MYLEGFGHWSIPLVQIRFSRRTVLSLSLSLFLSLSLARAEVAVDAVDPAQLVVNYPWLLQDISLAVQDEDDQEQDEKKDDESS